VPCPICKSPAPFDKALNVYRPFCSERCKLTDLGAWASGEYSVEVPPQNADEAEAVLHAQLANPADAHKLS
jgi:endogenous inhibitor of DNA gyrase (YacG/DUF329 family)